MNKYEERLTFLSKATRDVIWDWDLRTNKIWCSHTVNSVFGYKLDAGETEIGWWEDLIHKDDRARVIESIHKVIEEGGDYWSGEYRFKKADNTYLNIYDRGYIVRSGKGEPERIIGSMLDITDRNRATEKLRKSEELFKTYSEAMPQMAFISDPDGNIIYFNQRWYDYVAGLKGTEGWGWKDKQIHHPDDLQRTIDRWNYSLKTGEPYEIEYRLLRHDGKYRWHLGRAMPVRDDTGEIEMWLGTNTDIHNHKKTEEALRKSEEFNRALIENSPDCIKALDLDGNLLSINQQGLAMLEIDDVNSILGKNWVEFWRGEFYNGARAAFDKAHQSEIGHFQGESKTMSGKAIWWDVMIAPVFGSNGNIEWLISVSRDITQVKELERQKDDFISVASHELKTPVSSIKGSLQIIDRLYQDGSYEMMGNFIQKTASHIDKLTTLINDLLDVTKIQSGKMQYEFSEFVLKHLIDESLEQVSHQSRNHEVVVEGNSDFVVYADRIRLEQVIINLLTNAFKYSPDADKVLVKVSNEDKNFKIAVTDFGIGIPEKELNQVFDRFFQVSNNHHQFQGQGLGLYICSEIINRHGGELAVDSTEGQGSTFYFTLPKAKEDF